MPLKDPEKRRAYQREYMQRWYQENKSKHIRSVRKSAKKIEEWFIKYRETLICEICGENHPGCLDFHHIDPTDKTAAVSRIKHRPGSKAGLLKEIAKCRVLCANCHRKEHWRERQAKKKKAVE